MQIEIGMPAEPARREILQLHFGALRKRGRLTKPLCRAIDGSALHGIPKGRNILGFMTSSLGGVDLAGLTEDFSGADIAGLVRCAGSIALSRSRREGDGLDGFHVTLEDAMKAFKEVQQ